jgi:hypothetical protein
VFPVVAERAARGWRVFLHYALCALRLYGRGHGYDNVNYDDVAGDARLERAAFGSGDQRSIHLS